MKVKVKGTDKTVTFPDGTPQDEVLKALKAFTTLPPKVREVKPMPQVVPQAKVPQIAPQSDLKLSREILMALKDRKPNEKIEMAIKQMKRLVEVMANKPESNSNEALSLIAEILKSYQEDNKSILKALLQPTSEPVIVETKMCDDSGTWIATVTGRDDKMLITEVEFTKA